MIAAAALPSSPPGRDRDRRMRNALWLTEIPLRGVIPPQHPVRAVGSVVIDGRGQRKGALTRCAGRKRHGRPVLDARPGAGYAVPASGRRPRTSWRQAATAGRGRLGGPAEFDDAGARSPAGFDPYLGAGAGTTSPRVRPKGAGTVRHASMALRPATRHRSAEQRRSTRTDGCRHRGASPGPRQGPQRPPRRTRLTTSTTAASADRAAGGRPPAEAAGWPLPRRPDAEWLRLACPASCQRGRRLAQGEEPCAPNVDRQERHSRAGVRGWRSATATSRAAGWRLRRPSQ
jgi:hypothetical protein